MLENHANLATGFRQLRFRKGGQLLAANQYAPFRGTFQQIHTANECAFTGAGGANNAINLSGRDMQADVVQRLNGASPLLEHFGDIRKFNH